MKMNLLVQITDCLTSNTGKIHVILMPRKLLSIEKLFEEVSRHQIGSGLGWW